MILILLLIHCSIDTRQRGGFEIVFNLLLQVHHMYSIQLSRGDVVLTHLFIEEMLTVIMYFQETLYSTGNTEPPHITISQARDEKLSPL